MEAFELGDTGIVGCYTISALFVEDNRGVFDKLFEHEIFKKLKIDFFCEEVFFSHSHKNVIRGMHFQLNNPQSKIISVTSGKIFDVVVDLRRGSPTYGKWIGQVLSLENHLSMIVPRGCAHGFLTMSDEAIVLYICDGIYDRTTDTGIRYDDVDIGIVWPISGSKTPIVSKRDGKLMTFRDYENMKGFVWNEK